MKHVVILAREGPQRFFCDHFAVSAFDPTLHVPAAELSDVRNLDLLFRSGDRRYLRLLQDFEERFRDIDILVANWVNPFHPEWLVRALPRTVKILGCIDDPQASYRRTVASLFAFDGAFTITPSYAPGLSMEAALRLWGAPFTTWMPLSAWVDPPPRLEITPSHENQIAEAWRSRDADVLYIGGFYPKKYNSLIEWKRRLGRSLAIYGRWPFRGHAGAVAGAFGAATALAPERFRRALRIAGGEDYVGHRNIGSLGRIRSLSHEARSREYLRHKIALNMHLSERRETGNLRMYEAPFHGLMLLCDRGADDLQEEIFEGDREAVYYDGVEDGVEKARFYLSHDSARERIARAGYERVKRDYTSDASFVRFLQWAETVPLRR